MKAKKSSFWKRRFHNLISVFHQGPKVKILKILAIDLCFILLFVIFISISIAFAAFQLKGMEAIASGAIRMIPLAYSDVSGTHMQKELLDLRAESNSVVLGILFMLICCFIAGAVIIGGWCFVSISVLASHKMSFLSMIKYVGCWLLWSISWMLVLVILAVLTKGWPGFILDLVMIVVGIYFTGIFANALIGRNCWSAFIETMKKGITKIHVLGLAFILLLLLFVGMNILFYLVLPVFSVGASIAALIFFVFFISFSRAYIWNETKEVIR
ncbi:MAG: hypothetical protein KKD17_01430 [Nanoarchaeota archaeon]|nr:hypothetical protein [Nanoarchaeota archaeon]